MPARFASTCRASDSPEAAGVDRAGAKALDPRVVMRIKNLQLRARVIVDGFYAGIHRSPYHGFSVEFSEYRPYSAGDDLRFLDWRVLARSDRHYVKRFEDETNLFCYILADVSRSMSYGSGEYSKGEYARTLAGALALCLHRQRDSVGLVVFDEQIVEFVPPGRRPGHLNRLTAALDRESGGKSTDVTKPLEEIARTVRRRGLVVLISDLLTDAAEFREKLKYLRSRAHDVVVFRVLDPAELSFSFAEPSVFLDLESGRRTYVDPETARAQYLQRFKAHAAELEQACRDQGVDFVECPTDRPLELALVDLLGARARKTRQPARRAPRARRAP